MLLHFFYKSYINSLNTPVLVASSVQSAIYVFLLNLIILEKNLQINTYTKTLLFA
nr:MAG TPA: hypothetical protein [Caudoviricetes sp.]